MSKSQFDRLEATIEAAFEARDGISTATKGEVRDAVNEALNLLDSGKRRVAERQDDGNWSVNQWLKKAVLLSFRLQDNAIMPFTNVDGSLAQGYDKVPLKFAGWGRCGFPRRRFPRCAGRYRAPFGLCFQGRDFDAVLR